MPSYLYFLGLYCFLCSVWTRPGQNSRLCLHGRLLINYATEAWETILHQWQLLWLSVGTQWDPCVSSVIITCLMWECFTRHTSTVILLFKNRVNSFCSLCIRWRWYLYAFLAVYETLWKLYESLQFWICFVLRVAKSLLWLFLHLKMKPKCLLFFLSFLSYFIL